MHSEKLSTELKMLTSTMQFTSNEHTQPSSSPITPPPARDPLRGTVMKDCHAFGRRPSQAHFLSSRPTKSEDSLARSLRTQQCIPISAPEMRANRCSTLSSHPRTRPATNMTGSLSGQ
ncbi:hypothetical protein J2S57_004211 [Kineosporia succinea]|uniref:Uncharacterized protein n=1 Tax=Kineosporia succinea TaxID=84632 RepID=A0ABT9P6Y3_9ACTN|nr:hypothetical protein [Kineosporia succinea]